MSVKCTINNCHNGEINDLKFCTLQGSDLLVTGGDDGNVLFNFFRFKRIDQVLEIQPIG